MTALTQMKSFDPDSWIKSTSINDEYERQVGQMLMDFVSDKGSLYSKSLLAYGEEIYLGIRTDLPGVDKTKNIKSTKDTKSSDKKDSTKDTKSSNKKDSTGGTKKLDQIRSLLLNKSVKKSVQSILSGQFVASDKKTIELILIKLMRQINNVLLWSKEQILLEEPVLYEIISGSSRILKYSKERTFISSLDNVTMINVSKTAFKDLTKSLDKLKIKVSYSNDILLTKYPKFIYSTEYDEWISDLSLRPNECQRSLYELFSRIPDNKSHVSSILCFLRSHIASGKTSAAIMLCKKIKMDNVKNHKRTLFICDLQPVRNDMAIKLFNTFGAIVYGIAYMKGNDLVITKSYKLSYQGRRIRHDRGTELQELDFVIADSVSGNAVLEKEPDMYELLIYDEFPKLIKDDPDCVLKANIIRNAPPKVVLMSGDLIHHSKLQEIVDLFSMKYPNPLVETLSSTEIKTTYEIRSFHNDEFSLMNLSQDQEERRNIAKHVNNDQFLGRLFEISSIKLSLEHMKCRNLGESEGSGSSEESKESKGSKGLLEDTTIINQSLLRDIGLQLLNQSNSHHDSKDNPKDISYTEDPEESDDSDDDDEKTVREIRHNKSRKSFRVFSFDKLGTNNSTFFPCSGSLLIPSEQPLKFATRNFSDLTKNINMKELTSGLIKQDKLNKINSEKKDKEIGQLKSQNKINEVLRGSEQSGGSAGSGINVNVNKEFQINTSEHSLKYKNVLGKEYQRPGGIEHIPILELLREGVSEELIKYLIAGIGIYDPLCRTCGKSQVYISTILGLASQGNIVYLIATKEFFHGANSKISGIILRDQFAKNYNIHLIIQMLGRAGRVGKTWFAKSYIGTKTMKRIRNYLTNDLVENEDIQHVRASFSKYVSDSANNLANIDE